MTFSNTTYTRIRIVRLGGAFTVSIFLCVLILFFLLVFVVVPVFEWCSSDEVFLCDV